MDKGILYIAFGEKAKNEVYKSYASVRMFSDCDAVVIGDAPPVKKMEYIRWGHGDRLYNGRGDFLNGEVKPFLCKFTPFDWTLYLDADTTVLQDIMPGFDFLIKADLCVATHYDNKTIEDVNKMDVERDATIAMVGKNVPLINTGVMFFRKNDAIKILFDTWYEEWQEHRILGGSKEWDDQLALHRAIYRLPGVRVNYMPEKWNQKFKNKDTIIWHEMGSAKAQKERM